MNKDLADVLVTFVSRITKFCRSKFGETIPEGGAQGPEEQALVGALTTRIRAQDVNRCGDGVCQFTEKCGSNNSYDSCSSDCGACPP